MRGVDLEADGLVALRDDGERQADGEDAAVEEAGDHRADAGGVAHEERHDRVRSGNRLEARAPAGRRGTARFAPSGWPAASRPSSPSATSTARHGGRRIRGAERVRVDVGVGLLAHGFDQLGAAGDEPAVDAEGLAERADEDVHRARRSVPRCRVRSRRRRRCRASRPSR